MNANIIKVFTAIIAGISIALCPTSAHHKCHPHKHHYCVNPGGPIIKPTPRMASDMEGNVS